MRLASSARRQRAGEQLVEREVQVEHAGDGFLVLRGVVQPADQAEGVAHP